MIDNILIENFKCFLKQNIPLTNLSLFTGFNAAGKSSAIQSLLLGAQIQIGEAGERAASLNGDYVKLGNVGDVRCHFGNDKEIRLTYYTSNEEFSLCLDASNRNNNSLKFTNQVSNKNFEIVLKTLAEIIYVSAIRNGVSDVYPAPISAYPIHADVGDCGQFAPWWLQKYADDEICTERLNKSDNANSLRRQLNAWANELFPGAEFSVETIEGLPLVKLGLRTSQQQQFKRPANIGYGLTYVLPILIAGLLAKKGQILIVDSPEAHLHPRGQSRIGYFLAVVAASGVQVICETHSDHVLNGVRLAVAEKKIEHQYVTIHFFESSTKDTDESPLITSPQVDQFGNLDVWPDGFFDQSDKDIAKLNGWSY